MNYDEDCQVMLKGLNYHLKYKIPLLIFNFS